MIIFDNGGGQLRLHPVHRRPAGHRTGAGAGTRGAATELPWCVDWTEYGSSFRLLICFVFFIVVHRKSPGGDLPRTHQGERDVRGPDAPIAGGRGQDLRFSHSEYAQGRHSFPGEQRRRRRDWCEHTVVTVPTVYYLVGSQSPDSGPEYASYQ